MKKVLFIAAALFVCTSFSFALADGSERFDSYSFDPLTMSVLDYGVSSVSATSWDTSDQEMLADIREFILAIRNALITDNYYTAGSLVSNINRIHDAVVGEGSFGSPNEGTILYYAQYLPNLVSLQTMEYNLDYIEETTSDIYTDTSSLVNLFSTAFSTNNYYYRGGIAYSWRSAVGNILTNLTYDGVNPFYSDGRETTYSYIMRLASVLATKEDLELSESQKSNREEIENTFLTGSSSSTSLGASDFGDLSDVGGTVNDTLSLNGQASISSFTSGLSGADQEGQNWFSAATRDSLDSVSGSISTFALDDPYNMEGWEEQYSWVLGGE